MIIERTRWGNRRWNSSASVPPPGHAEEVRSLNAGVVEQGEEAAGVVAGRSRTYDRQIRCNP
jgi:hypothetical protein